MDVITSKHGLVPLNTVAGDDQVELSSLPLELQLELKRLKDDFTVDGIRLKRIVKQFEKELQDGLDRYGANISNNVTWVLGFPKGDEKGEYLVVDLGGTNIRVCNIVLKGRETEIEITQDEYKLADELKTGGADALWEFVAGSLEKFIQTHELKGTKEEPLQLGFTFSYPAHQDYIDHAKLVTWTKGFEIDGVEGEDVATQLREAMQKKDLPISLVAVINDTTGAMIASAYKDPETIVGAIFGTGCNGAYMENVGSIRKLDTDLPKDTPMAINCEYGAFDNSHNVLPRTAYDILIDEESPKPGEQAFEKMSAGLYLGEIFRLILLELHGKGIMFHNQDAAKLREPYLLDTGFLSKVEHNANPGVLFDSPTKDAFKKELNLEITDQEIIFARRAAQLISIRGARLCACGMAAICNKKNIKSGHVAADGSVANKHPEFKRRWAKAMAEVLDWPSDIKEDPITITSAEDGSGIGAAVITAMTLRRAKEGNMAGIKER